MVIYSVTRSDHLTRFTKISFICLILTWHSIALAKPQRWRATWWSDPATTIAVGWEQPEGGEAKFTYRERSPRSARHTSHTITVRAPTEREIKRGSAYWAQITGLKPDTAYEFEVGVRIQSDELIEAESEATPHPLIYRAQERSLPAHELWPQLDALEEAIAAQDVNAALALLAELVPEWRRDGSHANPASSITSTALAQ